MKDEKFYPNEPWGRAYLNNNSYLEFEKIVYFDKFEVAYELLNRNIVKLTNSKDKCEYAKLLKGHTLNNVAEVYNYGKISYEQEGSKETFYYIELGYFSENLESVNLKEEFLQVFKHCCFGEYFQHGTFQDFENCFKLGDDCSLNDIGNLIKKRLNGNDNENLLVRMYSEFCFAYKEIYQIVPDFRLNLCDKNLNVINKHLFLMI